MPTGKIEMEDGLALNAGDAVAYSSEASLPAFKCLEACHLVLLALA